MHLFTCKLTSRSARPAIQSKYNQASIVAAIVGNVVKCLSYLIERQAPLICGINKVTKCVSTAC